MLDPFDLLRPIKSIEPLRRIPQGKGYESRGNGSIADQPHEHKREIARRLRQRNTKESYNG